MAVDMCHTHNIFIRAVNSIYLQAPFIKVPSDVEDMLFYTKTLTFTIEAHHDGEEKFLFPGLVTCSGDPTIMIVNQAQHAAFHDALARLTEYCETVATADFSAVEFKRLIESFANDLFAHLRDEIPTILALKTFSESQLKPLWTRAEQHITDVCTFDVSFPLAFGCMDCGFEGGMHHFPPVPAFVKYVVHYWFARKHRGAWRFNPCDMWGRPRALHFLPDSATAL